MSNKSFALTGEGTFNYSHLAINKSRLKEFTNKGEWNSTRTFYLTGDTEFQIELFNPTDEPIGAKIFINGKAMSSSFLVLYPGQRMWLERDFISKDKFKFIVYEIDKNDAAAVEAASNNGKVSIQFYKQRKESLWDIFKAANPGPYIYTTGDSPYKPLDIRWENTCGADATGCSRNISSAYYANAAINTVLDSSITTLRGIDGECTYTSCSTDKVEPEMKETGIVGRSENRSSQEFKDVSMEFELLPFRTEFMQMLPMSEKLLTKEDTKIRKYCPYCGKKLKQSYRFCPACGTKVE